MEPALARAAASLLPAMIILVYGVLKTRSPLFGLTALGGVLAGMTCAMAAAAIEHPILNLIILLDLPAEARTAAIAFGMAGTVEETLKLLAALALAGLSGPRPAQRALLGCVAVSMGFAAFENLIYLRHAPGIPGLAALRNATAVPAHGLFALVMGSFLARARAYRRYRATVAVLIGLALVVPALLHGTYDFFALSGAPSGLPQMLLWVLAAGEVLSLRLFEQVLPLAQATDEDEGDPWPKPRRGWMLCMGLLALGWPLLLALAAAPSRSLAATLGMPAILPAAMAVNLLRGAFRQEHPTLAQRAALRV